MWKFSTRASWIAVLLTTTAVYAQPAKKPATNSAEEKFRPYRLEVKPSGDQASRLSVMKNASVNLDPPSAEDSAALKIMAKNYIFPITYHENYLLAEGPELIAKSTEAPSAAKTIATFRSQQLYAGPGTQPPPSQIQLSYIREFGSASIEAIEEVMAKNPPSIIRINVMRILVAVAESGSPAAFDKVVALLEPKVAEALPVDQLYYVLKAAEMALGSYDRERGNKWINRNQYFQMVTNVDALVRKMPESVLKSAYIPERPFTPELSTDPKTPKLTDLQPEQAEVVQVFRLQAIRALSKVRTDIVFNDSQDKSLRPLHTLAQIAVSDPAVVPQPSLKEVGEALIGLATMAPSDTLQTAALGLVLSKGTSDFIAEKAAAGREVNKDTIYPLHWKVIGTRMKNAYTAWEKEVQSPKLKLPKAEKDMLTGLYQTLNSAVFDRLAKQTDTNPANVDKNQVDGWYSSKHTELKSPTVISLYSDKPELKVTLERK
jgi:hypothetical protein